MATRPCKSVLLAALLLANLPATMAAAGVGDEAPYVRNLGLAPLRWQVDGEQTLDMDGAKPLVAKNLSKVVRESGRFRVINDALVQSLIGASDGYDKLKSEYELHASLAMEVDIDADSARFALKLVDQNLNHFLIERETIARSKLADFDDEGMHAFLESYVFKLLNRMPSDVYITSVQGNYVTISGGSELGVPSQGKLTFQRVTIAKTHPADGSWLSFQTTDLGTVEVVDVKALSSIGRILSQSHENALVNGAGARFEQAKSRAYFHRKPQLAEQKRQTNDDYVLVAPLYGKGADEQQKVHVGGRQDSTEAGDRAGDGSSTQAAAEEGDAPSSGKEAESPTEGAAAKPNSETTAGVTGAPTQHPSKAGPSIARDSPWSKGKTSKAKDGPRTIPDHLREYFDSVRFSFGLSQWNVSGAASASSNFPFWLVDHVGAEVTRKIVGKIDAAFGASFSFGGTGSGDYMGIGANARVVYRDDFTSLKDYFDRFYLGAIGNYTGLAVNKEKYGGGDWVGGGLVAGIESKVFFLGENTVLDAFSEFAITPLTIGRFGYDGNQKGVKSSMGWQFRLGGFVDGEPQTFEWGGSMGFGGLNLLFEDSKEAYISSFELLAMLRYRL